MSEYLKKEYLLVCGFLLSVFLLSLSQVQDTDTWIHLSLGREIFRNHGFPSHELFEYTMQDQAFSYSTWLFGLLCYLSYHFFNIYGLILFKASVITAGFFILIRDAVRTNRDRILAVVCMSVLVLMMMDRFVERPDILMLVYLSFSIFSLNAYLYDNKKYLYALPFVHVVWANSHSSIVIMVVPFSAFIVGGMIQHALRNGTGIGEVAPSKEQLKTVAAVFAASLLGALLSPYFIDQFFWGAHFLSNPWFKQNIGELNKPVWQFDKWPFMITGVIVFSFLLNFRRASVIDLLYVAPFLFLAFTAKRFLFVLGIVSGPVLVRNVSSFLKDRTAILPASSNISAALTGFWIVLYASLALSGTLSRDRTPPVFGFGINYKTVPEGALQYMDRKNIAGRTFNEFKWGGYIIWRDYPNRTVFIDPRGYLSNDLLPALSEAREMPHTLDTLYDRYGFESLLLAYPALDLQYLENNPGKDLSLTHAGWALVYWDDQSLLYVRRGSRYDTIIQKDWYRSVLPANGVYEIARHIDDKSYIEKVSLELDRNISETGSSRAYLMKGYIDNRQKNFASAIDCYTHVLSRKTEFQLEAYYGLAYAYQQLGNFDASIRYYTQSLSLKNSAAAYAEIAKNYTAQGDQRNALSNFRAAIEEDASWVNALAGEGYGNFSGVDRDKMPQMLYEKTRDGLARKYFDEGIAQYTARDYQHAIEAFEKSITVNPAAAAPYSNLGFIYFDTGNLAKACEYQKKALRIDPDYANAYYGLALAYTRQGEPDVAKGYWEAYLSKNPSGPYADKARQQIAGRPRQL